MTQKKLAMSVLLAVSSALVVGVGCDSDDEPGPQGDGLGTCELLCEAAVAADCGTQEQCLEDCEAVAEGCSSETENYLACAGDHEASDVTCAGELTALGIVQDCGTELGALQICALDLIAPGDGDGDGGASGGRAGGAGN